MPKLIHLRFKKPLQIMKQIVKASTTLFCQIWRKIIIDKLVFQVLQSSRIHIFKICFTSYKSLKNTFIIVKQIMLIGATSSSGVNAMARWKGVKEVGNEVEILPLVGVAMSHFAFVQCGRSQFSLSMPSRQNCWTFCLYI